MAATARRKLQGRRKREADPRCPEFIAKCYPFLFVREAMFEEAGKAIRLERPKPDQNRQMMLFDQESA